MNIYVGNLSFDATEEDLTQAFSAYGQVATVSIIKDKFSGESRGFGFVEMPDATQAAAAIEGMNGKPIKGRTIKANEAKPKESGGGGGGGYRGGGGGGGGGGRGGDRGGRR